MPKTKQPAAPVAAPEIARKLRFAVVRLLEANAKIEFPKSADTAFRDALQARHRLGYEEPAAALAALADPDGAATDLGADVRLYEASASIKSPNESALVFRVEQQRILGRQLLLRAAVDAAALRAASAVGAAGTVKAEPSF